MGFYDRIATLLGLRLITIDRPGVGESERMNRVEEEVAGGVLGWPGEFVSLL